MSAPPSPPPDPIKPNVSEEELVRFEDEGNKVESQEIEVDVEDDKLTNLEVENFTIKVDDENFVKWYNCNLCSKGAYHGQTYKEE